MFWQENARDGTQTLSYFKLNSRSPTRFLSSQGKNFVHCSPQIYIILCCNLSGTELKALCNFLHNQPSFNLEECKITEASVEAYFTWQQAWHFAIISINDIVLDQIHLSPNLFQLLLQRGRTEATNTGTGTT